MVPQGADVLKCFSTSFTSKHHVSLSVTQSMFAQRVRASELQLANLAFKLIDACVEVDMLLEVAWLFEGFGANVALERSFTCIEVNKWNTNESMPSHIYSAFKETVSADK